MVKVMINPSQLLKDEYIIEKLSSAVHDAWWDEKKKQGFHPPKECIHTLTIRPEAVEKFKPYCKKCHADMYPYEELPENIKDYDRVTVRRVLEALEFWIE